MLDDSIRQEAMQGMYIDNSFEKSSSSNSEYKVTMQPPVQRTATQNAEKNLEKAKLK